MVRLRYQFKIGRVESSGAKGEVADRCNYVGRNTVDVLRRIALARDL